MAHRTHPTMETGMQECIDACQQCHDLCLVTVSHCLRLGGKHAAPDHIRLLLDCAEICQTSANFMVRESPLHPETCGACATICTRCADDCERIAADDEMMRQCAEACRRCADSCARMAGVH